MTRRRWRIDGPHPDDEEELARYTDGVDDVQHADTVLGNKATDFGIGFLSTCGFITIIAWLVKCAEALG